MKSAWVRSLDVEPISGEWKNVFYSSPKQLSSGQLGGFIYGTKLLCVIFCANDNDCAIGACPVLDLPYEVNPDDVAFITMGRTKVYLFLDESGSLKLITFDVKTKEMELNTWPLEGEKP